MEQGAGLALALVIVANVVAVVVAAQITRRKGRGLWPGFVLGAFLGWIGVLVAWLLSSRTPQPAAERPAGAASPVDEPPRPVVSSYVGIDHVQVAAPEGREFDARRFYGGLLGLHELEKPAALRDRGGCWFAVGAQQLHVGVAPEPFVPAAKAHPALRLAGSVELHELADRLEAAGYDVAWADRGELPGTERFHVTDPFGNRLELCAAAAAKLPATQGPPGGGR
jgi:catechol 2,3-dioxygenase-like lactoylglutathione lyase family enzyme